MRRIIAVLLCFSVIFSFSAINAHAEENNIHIEQTEKADSFSLYYSVDGAKVEAYRKSIVDNLSGRGYTTAMIEELAPGILRTLRLFAEFTFEDKTAVCILPEGASADFSLIGDILPLFENGTDFTKGGKLSVKIFPATDDYPDANSVSLRELMLISCADTLGFSPAVKICYDIPAMAVNPNPRCYYLPLEKDLILEYPTMTGYVFTDWSVNSRAVSKIPAGAESFSVKADFSPRTYNVNYVITTDITYPFGRADNSANPSVYTYNQAQALYNIKTPVGGFHFGGWMLNGKIITEIPAGTIGDVVLYAVWINDEDEKKAEENRLLVEMTSRRFGDTDGDGKITVADARLALRIGIYLDAPTKEIVARADVFCTGIITVENARTILRMAIALDDPIEIYRNYLETEKAEYTG